MTGPVSFPIKDGDRERIEAVLEGRQPPAATRDAATVALIRDGAAGPEVYLMRRVRQMAFAAGMHVFPGGSVDPADMVDDDHVEPLAKDPALPNFWGRRRPSWWAGSFSTEPPVAAALVRAAIRETQEECDVLLRPADLTPLAHWITPLIEPRRYDTRFFLAALPDGQECREAGTEADARLWIRPQQALDDRLTVLPPTAAVLTELARYDSVMAAMTTQRTIVMVMPTFRLAGDRMELDLSAPS